MKHLVSIAAGLILSLSAFSQTAIIDLTLDGFKIDVVLYETDKEPVEIGSFSLKDKPVFMKRLINVIDSYKLNGYTLTVVTESKYILEKLSSTK